MTRNIFATLLIVLFITPFSQAQKYKNAIPVKKEKGALFFEKTYIDLGTIEDKPEPIKIIFKYKNIGKGSVKITNIKTDCNCSQPRWDNTETPFGKEGEFITYFYPEGLSGNVLKTLTLFSNGEQEVTYLKIRAYVDSKFARIKESYPEKQGNLKFSSYQVRIDKIFTYGVDSVFRTVYNPTNFPIRIKKVETPAHIQVTYDADIIFPDNGMTFKFKYNAAVAKDYGSKLDEIKVYTNDTIDPVKKFLVRANIVENFDLMTPKEKAKPPVFVAITPEVIIDTVQVKGTATATFYISNKGKTPMYIRKAYGSCGCTKIEYNPNQAIKKGKKAAIKVTYDAGYDLGKVEKQIFVITNTPDKALHELTLRANVMYIRKP